MDLGIIIILIVITLVFIKSYLNKKNEKKKYSTECFIDKLILPFSSLYELWISNNIINVDYIKKDHLMINTSFKKLFVIEVKDFNKLNENLIHKLFKEFSEKEDGFFYQAIIKDTNYQKQYIFSYSETLIHTIAKNINTQILQGEKALKVLKKVVFADDNKNKLDINTAIKEAKKQLSSQFEVYQGYKAKAGEIEDTYNKLKNTHFKGVIWGYYDFFQGRVRGYISHRMKDDSFYNDSNELVIINFILISRNVTKEQINKISNIYNISLVKKSINHSEIILKTPLKHRDVEWDLLVNLNYLSNQFIAKGK